MPPVFVNPEIGPASNLDMARHCVLRTVEAWKKLERHIDYLAAADKTPGCLGIYFDKNRAATLLELLQHGDAQFRQRLGPFVHALLKAHVVEVDEKHEKILKELRLPSALLGYALTQNGMALTFASNPCWEIDFIEFEGENKSLPNIWGQEELGALHAWLNDYYHARSCKTAIERMFKAKFCLEDIKEDTFTQNQWQLIHTAFAGAADKKFELCPPHIKRWNKTPLYYIRNGNHSNFTLRIFFIKRGDIIYVGDVYHKTTDNPLKEEAAADRSLRKFRLLGIVP